eukprot:6314698-Heterocapsa_arctica.AAC.1
MGGGREGARVEVRRRGAGKCQDRRGPGHDPPQHLRPEVQGTVVRHLPGPKAGDRELPVRPTPDHPDQPDQVIR